MSAPETPAPAAARPSRWRALLLIWLPAALLLAIVGGLIADPGLVVRGEFAKQRWLLGGESRSLVAAEHRWTYVVVEADRADAPTVVLLHGYTGSKENWYRMARALRGRYRLVIPDLPGWGQSERKPGANYGYIAQSRRMVAFLDALGGKPVTLVGHSMGGGIAVLTAAAAPERVARLGLIASAGVRFADNRFATEVDAGRNPFAVSDEATLERYLSTVFHNRETRPPTPWPGSAIYIAQRRRDAAFELSVLARIGRGEERFLPGEAARDIAQPTLLLWCRQDAVIDHSAMAVYAARIAHASQITLEGCGHMAQMERPAESAAAIDLLIQHGRPR